MRRTIEGFHQDLEGHWVADLSCVHRQHMRHDPPWTNRPWVLSESGRTAQIGNPIQCPLCDRLEFPDAMEPYRQTPEFTEDTIPAGLLREHTTKAGVWGLIQVTQGSLCYTVAAYEEQPERVQLLTPDAPGVVVPEMLHCVAATASPVRFRVEFYRRATNG